MAERLGVMALAPFELMIAGEKATFAALRPQFGRRAGMVGERGETELATNAGEGLKADDPKTSQNQTFAPPCDVGKPPSSSLTLFQPLGFTAARAHTREKA